MPAGVSPPDMDPGYDTDTDEGEYFLSVDMGSADLWPQLNKVCDLCCE